MKPDVNYRQLITDAITDPSRSYKAALETGDPVSLALFSVVDPNLEAATAISRLEAFISHHGPTSVSAQLLLATVEHDADLPDGLADAAETILDQHAAELPLDDDMAERVKAMIVDREQENTRRGRLLTWLQHAAPKAAQATACDLLADPDEPYGEVSQQAILSLAMYTNRQIRTKLYVYAESHLEEQQPDSETPDKHPEAALFVLDAIEKPNKDDLDQIGRILTRAAQQALNIEGRLDNLLRRADLQQIASIIQHLGAQESSQWAASQLLPRLIQLRPIEIAQSAGKSWWPSECRGVLAATAWENHDELLYPVVFQQIHLTNDESARATIRRMVAQRCQATSSSAATEMPRIGARALLKLCLQGEIPASDNHLIAALQALDGDSRRSEVLGARWKSTGRASRIGQVVAQVNGALLADVMAKAMADGPQTAINLVEGAGAPLIEQDVHKILEIADDDEPVLEAICRLSESAAARTLERWQSDHSMAAFRALEATGYAEARLEAIPSTVRSYKERSPADRAELLATYGPRDDRVEILISILADRSNPAGDRPTTDDLAEALRLLGEHLDEGIDPDRIVDAIGVICREAKQHTVRRAAYETLQKATPTARVVDLLLERNEEEAPSAKPPVRTALEQIADKLDVRAADPTTHGRAEAAEQLARIDLARAVTHARKLIGSDEVHDRMLAAKILGAGGSADDADELQSASMEEPNRDVREEMKRAVRRLLVGEPAAAHERIGEIAKISEPESWLALNPADVYGPWADPVVTGLNRLAEAESTGNFGPAIDSLDEVAKALLFRAIELAGDEIGLSQGKRAQAARNELDYGDVVGWQRLTQEWRPVRNLGALHELRTVHIAAKRTVAAPAERTPDDLSTAYSLFGLGANHCCEIIRRRLSSPEDDQKT